MRDSADSFSYPRGGARRGKRRQKFDDEAAFAKRDRLRERLAPQDADDADDGLPDGDRWPTWDQTENLDPNDLWRLRLCGGVTGEQGIRYWASGLPRPVTGSQPGAAW